MSSSSGTGGVLKSITAVAHELVVVVFLHVKAVPPPPLSMALELSRLHRLSNEQPRTWYIPSFVNCCNRMVLAVVLFKSVMILLRQIWKIRKIRKIRKIGQKMLSDQNGP